LEEWASSISWLADLWMSELSRIPGAAAAREGRNTWKVEAGCDGMYLREKYGDLAGKW